MMQMSLPTMQRCLGAELHMSTAAAAAEITVKGVSIDSRKLVPGNLFLALPGEHVHGHDYVAAAQRAGAAAALVSRVQDVALPQLVVEDVAQALIELARCWRDALAVTIIGVTGSNGKTTVKEMLAAILRQALPETAWLATDGNYNNELGVPLTLLRLQQQHRFAVIEMGCGQPGDISLLARLARPHIGIITSIGPAHLERLGSLFGVAMTKSELLAELPSDGLALYPHEAEHAQVLYQAADCATQTVAAAPVAADWRWQLQHRDWTLQSDGVQLHTRLALAGAHHASNAALAAAAALALGIQPQHIEAGLAAMQAMPGRGDVQPGLAGSVIINDSYNANPASLAAAIASLRVRFPEHEHWLVLGDMAELGAESEQLHAEAGTAARKAGIKRLFACGTLAAHAARAFGDGASSHADRAALLQALPQQLHSAVAVLVKGSRAAGMEQVVAHLIAASDVEYCGAQRPARETC